MVCLQEVAYSKPDCNMKMNHWYSVPMEIGNANPQTNCLGVRLLTRGHGLETWLQLPKIKGILGNVPHVVKH